MGTALRELKIDKQQTLSAQSDRRQSAEQISAVGALAPGASRTGHPEVGEWCSIHHRLRSEPPARESGDFEATRSFGEERSPVALRAVMTESRRPDESRIDGRSAAVADEAEAAYYAALSPAERIDILLSLVQAYRESLG